MSLARVTAFVLACLLTGSARAEDSRLAVSAAPPALSGHATVQVVVMDDAVQAAALADPEQAFRAVPGNGTARVTGVRNALKDAEPARTVLAFDQSGSFKAFWGPAFDLARHFADALPAHGRHTVDVVTFGVQLDDHGEGTDPKSLRKVLGKAESTGAIQGYTRLRNFMREAVERAERAQPLSAGGLRQVVVFTDAGEESPAHTIDDVVDLATEKGVRVHVVAFYKPGTTVARRLDEVQQVAERTGGRFIQVQKGVDAGPMLAKIGAVGANVWWLDLKFCAVPRDRGDHFGDEIELEVWSAGKRVANSGKRAFRQHASGGALLPCPAVAAAQPVTEVPQRPKEDGYPAWALPLGILCLVIALLALVLSLLRIRGRDKQRDRDAERTIPETLPAVPSSDRPPLDTADEAPSPFAPVAASWDNPLEHLPETHLILVDGPKGMRERVRVNKRTFTIGADPDCDLVLDIPQVSAVHCTLQLYPKGSVYIRDESSTNGTFLDHLRLETGGRRQLPPGHVVGLSQRVNYRLEQPAVSHPPSDPRPAKPPPPPPAPPKFKSQTIVAPIRKGPNGEEP